MCLPDLWAYGLPPPLLDLLCKTPYRLERECSRVGQQNGVVARRVIGALLGIGEDAPLQWEVAACDLLPELRAYRLLAPPQRLMVGHTAQTLPILW